MVLASSVKQASDRLNRGITEGAFGLLNVRKGLGEDGAELVAVAKYGNGDCAGDSVHEGGVLSRGRHQNTPFALDTSAATKHTATTVITATAGGAVIVITMTPASSEMTRVTIPIEVSFLYSPRSLLTV